MAITITGKPKTIPTAEHDAHDEHEGHCDETEVEPAERAGYGCFFRRELFWLGFRLSFEFGYASATAGAKDGRRSQVFAALRTKVGHDNPSHFWKVMLRRRGERRCERSHGRAHAGFRGVGGTAYNGV
jgi:hypothetical protein